MHDTACGGSACAHLGGVQAHAIAHLVHRLAQPVPGRIMVEHGVQGSEVQVPIAAWGGAGAILVLQHAHAQSNNAGAVSHAREFAYPATSCQTGLQLAAMAYRHMPCACRSLPWS